MLEYLIGFSIRNKLMVLLFTATIVGFGFYALTQISIGAVPDITNNQVQVITTSRNLSTQDVEQFITYPVELEMANLPGIREIRSVSKFGLSVVTIVFEERIGNVSSPPVDFGKDQNGGGKDSGRIRRSGNGSHLNRTGGNIPVYSGYETRV